MIAARFCVYYAAVFLMVGIHLPFWPAWLASRGLGAAEIAVVVSAAAWVRALGAPLVAHFADRSGAARGFLLASAAGATGCFALFGLADGFGALLVLSVVAGALVVPLVPLGEHLASRASGEHGFDYGRVRLWGSIAFVLAAYAGGWVVERMGDGSILGMIVGALAATFLAALALPSRATASDPAPRLPALTLLSHRPFTLFLLVGGLLQASHAVLYLFATIHWRAAGLSDTAIGALWAEGVVAEIVLFAFAARAVRWLGPAGLMLVAAVAGAVRWTVLAHSTDLAVLASVQWLHALTFGAAHLAAIHHMLRTVPESMAVTAQSLYSGVAVGAGTALTMLVAGPLFETAGGGSFQVMALLSVGAAVGAMVLRRHAPRGEV